jgi:hypothetical protein
MTSQSQGQGPGKNEIVGQEALKRKETSTNGPIYRPQAENSQYGKLHNPTALKTTT